MDAYSLAYFKQNFPTSKLYTQEIIQHSKLEYGVKVKNIELAACFREKRYTKESDLYEMADLILTKPLTVSGFLLCISMLGEGEGGGLGTSAQKVSIQKRISTKTLLRALQRLLEV